MGRVKFPFHVKVNGEYYPPGAAVDVDDVAAAVAQGAEPVMETKPAETAAEPARRVRKRKAE